LIEQVVGGLIIAAFSGFAGFLIARYAAKSSEGKLKILKVDFHPKGGQGAYLEAIIVNVGRGPIIIDYVLLRDDQGREEKRHPVIERGAGPGLGSSFGYWTSKKLEALERLEVRFNLAQLEIPAQGIVEFEALDTLDKPYKYRLPRKLQRDLEKWAEQHGSSQEEKQS
jgi:hypothetical protein